jgi:hypothetical protein
VYASLYQATVHGELEVPGDVAGLVVLDTEAKTRIPEERSQSICFNIRPATDCVVHEVEELPLAVDSQLACGGRVGMHLPHHVPVPDEEVVQGDLLVGVVVDMGIAVLYKIKMISSISKMSLSFTCKDPELSSHEEHLQDLQAQLPRQLPCGVIFFYRVQEEEL